MREPIPVVIPKEFYYHEVAYVRKLETALELISKMKGMCLIAPSLGPEADRGHQLGASKAFDQAADIAIDALKKD